VVHLDRKEQQDKQRQRLASTSGRLQLARCDYRMASIPVLFAPLHAAD
jgi:hypothetical protein